MNQSWFSRAEGSNDAQSDIGYTPGQRPFLAVDEWIWKNEWKIINYFIKLLTFETLVFT